ncbi:transglycosylase domain-containing protein [Tepidamorphus sp. 3E244]|uniref:transglycosylase domain-containing protein n=1 Tax=Tepidamorphus sp. 3E244 TaxID=3385498 RepID=UPI0038FBFB82
MNSDFRLYPEDRVSVSDEPRRKRKPADGKPRPPQGGGGGGGNNRGNGGNGGRGPGPQRRGSGGGRGNGGGQRRRRQKRRGGWWLFGKLVQLSLTLAFLGGLAIAGVLGYYATTLPSPSELAIPERPANVKIIAMDGTLIGNRGPTGGEAVRLFELPNYLPQAVMAIEDRRFYEHFGIDPLGLARAMAVNFRAGGVVQGGSTLTQQLAKNLFLEHERTMERKIQELLLAFWLEWTYSKDEIMEMYLNRVYLGEGATGVEAAAQTYYSKPASDVTLAEAATIAGLLKAPSRYAPTNNPERANARMRTVLLAMQAAGYVSENDVKNALIQTAEVKGAGRHAPGNYVADWVMEETTRLLGEVKHDIIVETTVNPRLQKLAEKALTHILDTEGADRGAQQGALMTIDTSGAVRAMLGGRDYAISQFNRAIKAKRQPGSAFKPFVYATAMEYGMSPDTLRADSPVQYGDWAPKNYDGKYRGPMTLADALSKSINTVSVKLTDEVGPKAIIQTAQRMGIDSEMQPNLSLALGTSEVSLYELTRAYVPLANGGFEVLPHIITRIRDVNGKVLFERDVPPLGQVLSEQTVGAMNYMMQMTVSDGTARRAILPDGRPAAGKTGTTQDFRDAWFVGYTADLVTGVWIGNDDRTPMKKVTGGNLPAMVWNEFMAGAHEGFPVAMLPGEYIPSEGTALAVDESLPWLEPGQQAPGARANDDAAIVIDGQERQQVRRNGGGNGGGVIGGIFRSIFGG